MILYTCFLTWASFSLSISNTMKYIFIPIYDWMRAKNIKDPVFSFASKCNRMNFNAIISLFLSNRTRVNNVYQGLSSLTLIRMLFACDISICGLDWPDVSYTMTRRSYIDLPWISHHKHNNMIYDGYCTFSCHIPIVPLWIWNGNKRFNLKRAFKKVNKYEKDEDFDQKTHIVCS